MADMPTDFWAGWIAVLTVVSLLGLAWLVFSIYFIANRQEQPESPVWDHTLTEDKHPAPMWWFWMTLAALVFTVIYLILYPGLGSFSGTLKWSQHGRHDHSFARYNERFSSLRKNISQRPIVELKNNPAIMESAQRIYSQNCAACHGVDGQGQALAFPNLKDEDWQWGDTEAALTQTLKQGRRAVMIGWIDVLGEEGVWDVINYVKTLSSKKNTNTKDHGGKIYQENCSACHGLLGEGNQILGAPNLADTIWLYGNEDDALYQTIAHGRSGVMPAFEQRLNELQIRLLVAWLMPSEVKGASNDKISSIKVSENASSNANKLNNVSDNGKQVYKQYCESCHQANGEGVPGVFPSLVGNEVVLKDDPSEHINVVLNGLSNKEIDGVKYVAPMPGFSMLSDDEVAAVVNHERSNWGNDASLVDREIVSAKRQAQ